MVARKGHLRLFLEEKLEEEADLLVRLRGDFMPGAVGQTYAILQAQDVVHRNGVVETLPAFRRVFRSSGHEERAGSDESVEFVQVPPVQWPDLPGRDQPIFR